MVKLPPGFVKPTPDSVEFGDGDVEFGGEDVEFAGGIEAAGFNPVAEESPGAGQGSFNREELIFDQLSELLVIKKANSEMYQQGNYTKNTQGLQEADKLRRKLGG